MAFWVTLRSIWRSVVSLYNIINIKKNIHRVIIQHYDNLQSATGIFSHSFFLKFDIFFPVVMEE